MPELRKKKALVLGGGGLLGAMYEIGCLAALERRTPKGSLEFDMCLGTSGGSVVASLLAAGYSAAELLAMVDLFSPSNLYRLDGRSLTGAIARLPFRLVRQILSSLFRGSAPLLESLGVLQEAVPAGLFTLGPLARFVRERLKARGVPDSFAHLTSPLYVPAIDLDTGERLAFGDPDAPEVPVSIAVAASCATPRFFLPVAVGDRQFIDGGIADSLNIDLAISLGARDILVVNPLVAPFNDRDVRCLPSPDGRCGHIGDQGLAAIMSQAIKIGHMIHTGMSVRLQELMHPEVSINLIQPDRLEVELDNPMDFSHRDRLLALGELDGTRFATA